MQSSLTAAIALLGPAGERLSHRDVSLLQAIAGTGSVAQAARECGMSYRHAWGRVAGINAWAGRPWVTMERGRGAALSAQCVDVLSALADVDAEIGDALRALSERVNSALAAISRRHRTGLRWRLSHDLLIEEALRRIERAGGTGLDVKYSGSGHNLDALARGDCEIAGFHIPASGLRARMRRLGAAHPELAAAGDVRVVHLMDRKQGLIVAAGNPKRIRGITDLARRGVRFINRQANSGSRELLDALLKTHGVSRARIGGYVHEEFTHFAVAAAVASGAADVAFGIEAAARRLALGFVPLVDEVYLIAGSDEAISSQEVAGFLAWFRSKDAVAAAAELGGYATRGAATNFGFS